LPTAVGLLPAAVVFEIVDGFAVVSGKDSLVGFVSRH
jgi:hypothetical protein